MFEKLKGDRHRCHRYHKAVGYVVRDSAGPSSINMRAPLVDSSACNTRKEPRETKGDRVCEAMTVLTTAILPQRQCRMDDATNQQRNGECVDTNAGRV